jgi:hypothetical protein
MYMKISWFNRRDDGLARLILAIHDRYLFNIN